MAPASKAAAKKAAAKRAARKPAAKAAAAARAEVEAAPEPKTVEFKGITLTVPDDIPATMLFDLTDLSASGDGNPLPYYRLLRTILGPFQFMAVKSTLDEDPDVADIADASFEALTLLNDILDHYGLSLGN